MTCKIKIYLLSDSTLRKLHFSRYNDNKLNTNQKANKLLIENECMGDEYRSLLLHWL